MLRRLTTAPFAHLLLLGLFVLAACGGDDTSTSGGADTTSQDAATADGGNGTDAGSTDGGSGADTEQPPACRTASKWTKGTKAFVEATTEWGLKGVEGTRVSVLDYDGDGRPDVLIRGGDGPEDFTKGERRRWLLRNTATGFVDVTAKSGLFTARGNQLPGGLRGSVLASGDVDNDGDLDIFVARAVHDPNADDYDGGTSELLLNNGDGTFKLGPDSPARMAGKPAVPAGVTFVDVDRDGNLDLWITHNMASGHTSPLQDKLRRGDGKGGFVDITAKSKLNTLIWSNISQLDLALGRSWAWSSAACDLNNDGVPELLASSYGRAPNHLWRAVDDGTKLTYVNESVASGYAYDHRVDWWTDINAQCYCMDNPKAIDCDIPKPPADPTICPKLKAAFNGNYRWDHNTGRHPFRMGGNSGATVCADLNNDGFIDLLTGEIVHPDVGNCSDPTEIMFNAKDPAVRFTRPGPGETGLVRDHKGDYGDMANAVLDFDNDGWPDIYVGSSDYPGTTGLLFHQKAPENGAGPTRFVAVPYADYFKHNRSSGVVAADFDLDGDLDLLVGHSRMRCNQGMGADCYATRQVKLFLNQVGAGGNHVRLTLVGGKGTNRSAIGARVEVRSEGVWQTREIDGGHGHFNTQKDKSLHFGLPGCTAKVTILWPDKARSEQVFEVAANRHYRVEQGKPPVVVPSP